MSKSTIDFSKMEPVIFRIDLGVDRGDDGKLRKVKNSRYAGSIVTVYPCEPSDYAGLYISADTLDGFTGASWEWVHEYTRPATPAEYQAELEKQQRQWNEANDKGIVLKPYRKNHPFIRDEFNRRVRKARKG